jgi:hypothetical protein
MFAKKQPGQLRERLEHLQAQVKMGKLTREQVAAEAVEILMVGERERERERGEKEGERGRRKERTREGDWRMSFSDEYFFLIFHISLFNPKGIEEAWRAGTLPSFLLSACCV